MSVCTNRLYVYMRTSLSKREKIRGTIIPVIIFISAIVNVFVNALIKPDVANKNLKLSSPINFEFRKPNAGL